MQAGLLSQERGRKSERRRCSNVRKATPMSAKSRALIGLCALEDPSMHGNFTRENREVPSTPDMQLCRAGWRRT